jgi:SHS2 domain-containing protein
MVPLAAVAMKPVPVFPEGGFSYFDHDADIGVVGRGKTIEEAFEGAARATFAIMADPGQVGPVHTIALDFEEADVEIALVRWLNLLITLAREHRMVFCRFRVERDGVHWRGAADGEAWRPGLDRGVEVKGATLTMLQVKQGAAGWEARCVVDV